MDQKLPLKRVQLRDAKASFSALVAAAERGEATVITKHGRPVARVVPEPAAPELRRVSDPASPYHGMTLGDLLLNMPGPIDLERDETPMREIDL